MHEAHKHNLRLQYVKGLRKNVKRSTCLLREKERYQFSNIWRLRVWTKDEVRAPYSCCKIVQKGSYAGNFGHF